MKKSLFTLLAVSLSFAACQHMEPSVPEEIDYILSAQIEQDEATKTLLSESSNILWSENDQIVAFMKTSYGHKYQIQPSFVGKSYANFSKISSVSGDDLFAGMEWDHIVAYYPYSEGIECLKSGDNYTLEVVLPAEQTYVAKSFGNGTWPMVAVSEDNDITFKNVCGGMLLQLKGTQKVTSITVHGKNNEVLSGSATVKAYTDGETKPAITMTGTDAASKSVTLHCGEGVQLSEGSVTEFILSFPPVVFTKGFTVTIKDSEENKFIIETDKENVVLRSSLLVMPEIILEEQDQPTVQQIDYVDEYGKNRGPGVKVGETIWAPVNCGYHETDFKYGKLYQWGRKYGQGYKGWMYDIDHNYVGIYSDATIPEIVCGPVSLSIGQSMDNENKYYYNYNSTYNSNPAADWCSTPNDNIWNSGTEDNPVKTDYDPCPNGWRVPTYDELVELSNNYSSWTTNESGQIGIWFSGANVYTEIVPQVFFSAAGMRIDHNGGSNYGQAKDRGSYGRYWSSRAVSDKASGLGFIDDAVFMSDYPRVHAQSVRCVQE